ncbi:MAG: class B sortase [Bacilli bacterium]|nr:class B sortase [Bacilli bacterium]
MKEKKKFRLKKKYRAIIRVTFFTISLTIFIFSIFKIILWNLENRKTEKLEKKIIEKTEIIEISEINNEENSNLVNEPVLQTDIYWKYKDTALIDVNLNELKKDNKDTIGWIQVLGTDINYPFVQSGDNDYYLKHDFAKSKNTGGWIFLDYRNNINNLNDNNIIYGHMRKNGSMFGSLKNVLTSNWQNNSDNHIVKISTEEYSYLFQVFSIYTIPVETYYIQTDFSDIENYKNFLNTIVNRSIYNFNTEVNEKTKVLTLSTCHNNNDRLVVHAKLIKAESKNN